MLRLSVALLLSMIFFSSASQSAIIVAGDLTGEEQEKVDRVLRTYTGPAPKYFEKDFEGLKNPEVHTILLNNDIPFAEVEFLKSYFEKEQLKVSVAYVPSTIWNLHVINKYLTDEEKKQSYDKMASLFSNDEAYRTRYFDLSNELMSTLDPEPMRDTKYFISLSNNYLRNIEQHKTKANEWSQALAEELQKIESNSPSLLHKMIAEEMEAGEKNKILLVRGTNGLKLKSQATTREEAREFYRKRYRRLPEEELEKIVNEYYVEPQWYEDMHPHESVLDFPLKSLDDSLKTTSAWASINDFQNAIKENEFMGSKDLSYADSLLAGYLFDSFNRKQSACSFVYFSQKPDTTLYTLHLDKNWLFSKGHQLFHRPSLETDGIFGMQETFHPRLRNVQPSSKMMVEWKNRMMYSTTPSNLLESSPESVFQKTEKLTEENAKIIQYILNANEVISQARIIAFKGEIVESQNYPEEAMNILKNQKKLSTILQEKMAIVL